jgi:hypothetical protein
MHFKKIKYFYIKFIPLLLGILFLQSCGVLGKKEELNQKISFNSSSDGCLNSFGPNTKKYIDGEIESAEWAKTWDCTVDSLEVFKQFVKGSSEDSFTQEDMQNFVANFLVTNKPVTKRLIDASFALKASILGGTKQTVTKKELDKLIVLLKLAKEHTLKILPLLRLRRVDPKVSNLLELSDKIQKFSDDIAEQITSFGSADLTAEDAQSLMEELGKIHDWDIDKDWILPIMAVKSILLSGAENRIEGLRWPDLFRIVGALGGPAVATISLKKPLLTGPNEYGNFIVSIIHKVRPIIDNALILHKGTIGFDYFNRLIDVIPETWLPDEFRKYNREGIKKIIRPIFNVILEGGKDSKGLTQKSVDVIYNLMDEWNRGQTHLETIFQKFDYHNQEVTPTEFTQDAETYAKTLSEQDKASVQRLIHLAADYIPMFRNNDDEITFDKYPAHSLNNLSKLHWMNLAVKQLIKVYGEKDKITEKNAFKILSDFRDALILLKMIDPTIKDLHAKRVQDADIFMYSSNGDGMVDEKEGTYYLAVLTSSGNLTSRMRALLEPSCKLSNFGGIDKQDVLGWQWMNPQCWRDKFFSNYMDFMKKFVPLRAYYTNLLVREPDEADKMRISLESAARRYGYCDRYNFGGLDTMSMAGILHYVEMMFLRYDLDYSQSLDVHEALNAYPNFKSVLLKAKSNLDPDDDATLKAAFTYTVKFSRMPSEDLFGNPSLIHFIWWMTNRHLWNINAPRASIYNILPVLSIPDTVPPGQSGSYNNGPIPPGQKCGD